MRRHPPPHSAAPPAASPFSATVTRFHRQRPDLPEPPSQAPSATVSGPLNQRQRPPSPPPSPFTTPQRLLEPPSSPFTPTVGTFLPTVGRRRTPKKPTTYPEEAADGPLKSRRRLGTTGDAPANCRRQTLPSPRLPSRRLLATPRGHDGPPNRLHPAARRRFAARQRPSRPARRRFAARHRPSRPARRRSRARRRSANPNGVSIIQPKVASHSLPWVHPPPTRQPCKGCTPTPRSMQPLQGWNQWLPSSQGSLATLGNRWAG